MSLAPGPRPGDDDVATALRASHLGGLPPEALEPLVARAVLTPVDAGAVVHRQGRTRPHLDLVVAGLVRVYVTAPDGRTMTVRYVRRGGLVGAVSLFASRFSLPATIQAVTATRLLRLEAATVRQAAETDVRVARALIDELAERVQTFLPEIPSGAFATVRQRVARHLLDLASSRHDGGPWRVAIRQRDLADAVGSVREVVVRALRTLRREGLIRTGRNGVVVLDPERLATQAYPTGGVASGQGWNAGS